MLDVKKEVSLLVDLLDSLLVTLVALDALFVPVAALAAATAANLDEPSHPVVFVRVHVTASRRQALV